MTIQMEFGLLGPLLVRAGGLAAPIRPGKQRAVLAALLLNAGQVVPVGELAEILWGSALPPSARVSVQNYVGQVRRALGEAGAARIVTEPRGYLIRVNAGELDLARFEELLASANAAEAAGSWEIAAAAARAALELWRGSPLANVESDVLALREIPRLAELRLTALEARIGADLRCGRHAAVIAELRQLTAAQPLREPLHALLMLALHRDGRRSDALAAYQHARAVLVGELGVEPGARLRELHQQILADDPHPAVHLPAQRAAAGPAVPRELPASVRNFTGRARELAELTRLIGQPGEAPAPVVISAIGGTAGVGKTALAVHWAHQVAGRFPDGQLYVDLCGYDPGPPLPATDALAGFLRALGVPGDGIPAGETERAARYRSLLAGRRMLVVLDNAGSAGQVRPLLPGAPACAAIVTSRDALSGLVVLDGAARLDLDLLPQADAVGLLRELIGSRVDADPAAAAALAQRCCRLPLALRIAAELAVLRPAASLASLADELADQQRRLDKLDADNDPRACVRSVLSWSYRTLDADSARAYRLLGLHPGPSFDVYLLAALTGSTMELAARLTGQLASAYLIHPTGSARYSMHDLLRAYARELAGAQDGQEEQHAALTRLFDHCLHTAAMAMNILFPAEAARRPRVTPPGTPVPPLTSATAARGWLAASRATLIAIAQYTAEHGWPSHCTRLAAIVFRYFDASGYYPDSVSIHTCALTAARRSDDHNAEAEALTSLGVMDWRLGHYQQATGRLSSALAVFRRCGDRAGQARALGNLGNVAYQMGHYQQAATHTREALAHYGAIGDAPGQARQLHTLGAICEQLHDYREAALLYQRELTLCRQSGSQTGQAYALNGLAAASLGQGHPQQAANHLHQALALFRQAGDRAGEADALINLGAASLGQGHHERAADCLRQALVLYRQTGDRAGEVRACNALGEALLRTGQPSEARGQHLAALNSARQIGEKHEQARALDGLARGYHATGDSGQARRYWQQARILYLSLGSPEADDIQASLAIMDHPARRSPPGGAPPIDPDPQ